MEDVSLDLENNLCSPEFVPRFFFCKYDTFDSLTNREEFAGSLLLFLAFEFLCFKLIFLKITCFQLREIYPMNQEVFPTPTCDYYLPDP